jgi:O-antigen/teichoic acid export membrane protein
VTEAVAPPDRWSDTSLSSGLVWRLAITAVGVVGAFVNVTLAARLLTAQGFAGFLLASLALVIGPPVARHGSGRAAIESIAHARAAGRVEDAAAAARHALRATVVIGVPVSIAVGLLTMAGVQGPWFRDGLLVGLIVASEAYRLSASDIALGWERHVVAGVWTHSSRVLATTVAMLALLSLGVDPTLTVVLALVLGLNVSLGLAARWSIAWDIAIGRAGSRRRTPLLRGLALTLPFLVVELSGIVVARGDVWISARTLTGAAGARSGAAATLATQLMIPTAVLAVVLAPAIARLWNLGRRRELQDLLHAAATLSFTLVAGAALAVVAMPTLVLTKVFGEDLEPASGPFVILVAGAAAFALTGVSGSALLMTGEVRAAALVGLASAALGGVVGWWAATSFGGAGLAIASTAAIVSLSGAQVVVLRWRTGLSTLPAVGMRRAVGIMRSASVGVTAS